MNDPKLVPAPGLTLPELMIVRDSLRSFEGNAMGIVDAAIESRLTWLAGPLYEVSA